jgi:hypothetical protein
MAEFKSYVAVQEFILNIDEGKKEFRAKYGDLIDFDGITVRCKDVEGQARSFERIVRDGEWVKYIAPEKVGILKQRLESKFPPLTPIKNEGPLKDRNDTGGKIVESSDLSSTKLKIKAKAIKDSTVKELVELIADYDNKSFPKSVDSEETNKKLEENDKRVSENRSRVINYDDDIVAPVTEEISKEGSVKNTSGVELEDLDSSKLTVVSEEERVVKSTSYAKKGSTTDQKKLVVDKDSEGIVVRKTSVPAISKTEVNENTKVNEDSLKVSNEEVVVSETNYDAASPTDVGSSTKAGVVASSGNKSTSKKAVSVDVEDQGAVFVGKVSRVRDFDTVEGISVKTTVGSPKESLGEAKFSSGGDGVENTEAKFSGTGPSVTDLSGSFDSEESSITAIDGGDIDISDLLD